MYFYKNFGLKYYFFNFFTIMEIIVYKSFFKFYLNETKNSKTFISHILLKLYFFKKCKHKNSSMLTLKTNLINILKFNVYIFKRKSVF